MPCIHRKHRAAPLHWHSGNKCVIWYTCRGGAFAAARGAKGVLRGVLGQHIIGLRCTATVLYIVYEPNALH